MVLLLTCVFFPCCFFCCLWCHVWVASPLCSPLKKIYFPASKTRLGCPFRLPVRKRVLWPWLQPFLALSLLPKHVFSRAQAGPIPYFSAICCLGSRRERRSRTLNMLLFFDLCNFCGFGSYGVANFIFFLRRFGLFFLLFHVFQAVFLPF